MTHTNRLGRRSWLQLGLATFSGLLAMQLEGDRAAIAQGVPPPTTTKGKARSLIVLWLGGGASQLDTFDPKPGTKNGGPTKAIKTRTPGLLFTENLPLLAERSDRFAVIRSLTKKEGNHQRATYQMHTGYAPTPTVQHPGFGSYLSEEFGPMKNGLPAGFSIGAPGASAGFLGAAHRPFFVNKAGAPLANIAQPGDIDAARLGARRGALGFLENSFEAETEDGKIKTHDEVLQQAYALMESPELPLFDLSSEPEASKKKYGDTDFGRGCLLARRLVEKGTRYVEVTLNGWDTHQDNFGRVTKLCQTLDPALSALLDELQDHKLLDETLVLCVGDFGRTPLINANEGRDHYPQASSLLLAGGGLRRHMVLGETDPDGVKVTQDPVLVPNLFATLAVQLGLPLNKVFSTPAGRPIQITDNGTPLHKLLPG